MNKCRLCLKNSKKLTSIFDKENDILFIDMITSISNINIDRDDEVTNLCLQCRKKLKEAFDFKKMMEMSNLIYNEDKNSPKRIHFNNFDEIKVEFDIKPEINKYDSDVLEYFKHGEQLIHVNNTIIKKIEPDTHAPEIKSEICEYIQSFTGEPNYDLEQDYDFEDSDASDMDMEYVPPKRKRAVEKEINMKKGKENRSTNRKENKVVKRPKPKEMRKVLIKPVILRDIAIVRTHVGKKKTNQSKLNDKNKGKQMCNFCGKMTSTIKTHILVHTGKRTHQCDKCLKSYYTAPQLKAHMKKHEFSRKFECDQCTAKFNDRSSLNGHRAVHNDAKVHECPICNKSFKRRHSLRRHVIHHNTANKTIKCDQCAMSFFSRPALRHHIRVHTGERPYRCEMCSQGYSYKHDFNRHCFKKHGVFLKRRPVYVMNEEVLVKERELMRALMLKLHGEVQSEDPFKEFDGPQGYKALEQAIELLETKQLQVDVQFVK